MHRTTIFVTVSTGILLVITLVLTYVLPLHYKGGMLGTAQVLPQGWFYDADDMPADPEHLVFEDHQTAIHTVLKWEDAQGRSLCFVSRNMTFTVYADAMEIYDFHPELSGFYGRYYGDQVHMVQLPYLGETMTLHIEGTALIQNRWTGLTDLTLEHSGGYLRRLLYRNAGSFGICMMTFFVGIVFFTLGIVEQFVRKRDMLELISLGTIAMTLSVWSSFPTHIIQLISGNFAATRAFEHITLILLPIPVLVFVCALTKNLDSLLLHVCISASVMNLILQLTGVLRGVADYHDLLFLSHTLIVIGVVAVVYFVGKAIRQKQLTQEQRSFLLSALAIIFSTGLIDMIRYFFTDSQDVARLSRFGLFLFVMILAVYEYRKLLNIQTQGDKAEELHHLAMEDSLTGLLNRTAFNYFEASLKERTEGKCMFVQLDVNYLKKVNDTYGHSEGDRHILAAASVLRESFGQYGKVYRVGGDEFIAVLDSGNCDQEYILAVTAFRVKQQQYNERMNPPVPLQIACGMAEYDFSTRNPEAAERLADTRMYENKKSLKLANA